MLKTLISALTLLALTLPVAGEEIIDAYSEEPREIYAESQEWHVLTRPETIKYKGDENFQSTYVDEVVADDWKFETSPLLGKYAYQCGGVDGLECAAMYCSTDGVMQFAIPNYDLDASVIRFWQLDPTRRTKMPVTLMAAKSSGISDLLQKPMVTVNMQKALAFEFVLENPNPDMVVDFSYSLPNAVEAETSEKIQTHIFRMQQFFGEFQAILQDCNALASEQSTNPAMRLN